MDTEKKEKPKAEGVKPNAVTEPAEAETKKHTDAGKAEGIGDKEVQKALETLKAYKEGRQNLEKEIIENEKWYRLQHWEELRKKAGVKENRVEPTSAWLFNSLMNKHADAVDNYPEPAVLPREPSDVQAADTLSEVIPAVLERNKFDKTYSDAWWYKLKQGVVPYGVFWNNSKEKGLGDIDITKLDILNILWEPGVKDIQDSRNLFIVNLEDTEILQQQYPELSDKLGSQAIEVAQYEYDDDVDVSNKTLVIDWYYKRPLPPDPATGTSPGEILHYAKIAGEALLFASENDAANYPNGWYNHGQYPVVMDVLFPEEGTPIGFGYISIMKSPQTYIDKLCQLILENAGRMGKPRYWGKADSGINEQEFLDWSKPIVHVQGEITDERLKAIDVQAIPGSVLQIYQMKIDELKETSANRDVSQGGIGSGVTAAAAIAALQEAGNKTSRDMILASYRAYTDIVYLVIELMRQFYTEDRYFRIEGVDGAPQFVNINSGMLAGQQMNPAYAGQQMEEGYSVVEKEPIFDIKIKPQKRSMYNTLAQNEFAKELYQMGVFNPENATQALAVLDMMQFEGIEEVRHTIQQNKQQYDAMMMQQMYGMGGPMMPQMGAVPEATVPADAMPNKRTGTEMTNYGQELAQRAVPRMGE